MSDLQEINRMIAEREGPTRRAEEFRESFELESCFSYPSGRRRRPLTIFLGYTSNMVTSGLREVSVHIYVKWKITRERGNEFTLLAHKTH